jgi:hypothetical protein
MHMLSIGQRGPSHTKAGTSLLRVGQLLNELTLMSPGFSWLLAFSCLTFCFLKTYPNSHPEDGDISPTPSTWGKIALGICFKIIKKPRFQRLYIS